MITKKVIIVVFAVLCMATSCLIGDSFSRLNIKNNRSGPISIKVKIGGVENEKNLELVSNGASTNGDSLSRSPALKPVSEFLDYVRVYDSNSVLLLDLNSSNFEDHIIIESESDSGITYLLKIN